MRPDTSADPTALLRAQLQTQARYNVWATRRLYEHVDALPEADYRRDVGLFFKSVHGTLNHLLVAEHGVWWPRFAQGLSPKGTMPSMTANNSLTWRGFET